MKTTLLITLFAATPALAGSNTTKSGTPTPSAQERPTTNPGSLINQRLTDGEIIAFIIAINEHEIAAAKGALNKKDLSKEIKSFAKDIKNDHEKNLKDIRKLSEEFRGQTSDTTSIISFRAKSTAERNTLTAQETSTFESAFIDAMVKGHQDVLNKIDQQFVPSAQSPELQKHLEKTRKSVEHHLEKAKELQVDHPRT